LTAIPAYNITLNFEQLKLLRWAIQVGVDSIAIQPKHVLVPEEAMRILAHLEDLHEAVVGQAMDQQTEDESEWKQLSLFDAEPYLA